MNAYLFITSLTCTITVVGIAMLYLRRTTRQVVTELCKSEAGAEFWLRCADIMAYSGSLMLVLIFGNATTMQDWVEAIRLTLILALSGIFITVMFVARNVWRTVTPSPSQPQIALQRTNDNPFQAKSTTEEPS